MSYATRLGLGVLVSALVLGCGVSTTKDVVVKKSASTKEDDDHEHGKGPNGGVVFDLGKYHAEFTVNHDKKECQVLILGDDQLTPTPISAKELTLTTKETKTKDDKAVPAMTIKLTPKDEKDGKAAKFVGSDPGLGNVADFSGTVLGEVNGKPAQGEFKE